MGANQSTLRKEEADPDNNNPFTIANDYIRQRIEIMGLWYHDMPDSTELTQAKEAFFLL
uniref:Uncharacterized protein n=1 Tax=Plectus sambesii TaxID=2011161 RepID=A0A914V0D8_9BILA